MKKIAVLLLLTLFCKTGISQIKFDISKIRKTDTEKFEKENLSNVIYLDMTFGGSDFVNTNTFKKLENKIIKKVQYVYSDYPKDFDYSELVFQRFASLYVELPQVFNKSWIEWEIIKQTKCSSAYEASSLFHGFVITFKDGAEPNKLVAIPPDIQKKLDKITSSVEFFEIKSTEDLSKFLAPKEIKISDIKYPNKTASIKLFKQKDAGALTIVEGLFLTTGIPQGAIGPNNSPSVSSVNYNIITPDKNLSSLVGNSLSLFDAAIIEFDIQIDADSLVFKYAFASEEYPEYLQYNDVFGLFISGQGLNNNPKDTTYNLASLPDGKTPISVSSINHLKNSNYYISNDYNSDLKIFKTWQYDGFTKVLTAKIKVKPKHKYHIKFAIADYGDPYYDSAIFIDAFGIKTPKTPLH
ncbi:MAG: choice-of-anchor L domain-containing protein [Bacteroidetes bacterium]|nr:choice-of-anchor L domain-containing protein [Bacteroidota bacterium]